ncbi:uncharacterized protein PGTG_21668 [Puccinia graminis f. sp. tritici CRL 75-36-700-3]|uniref:Uncharacterized protein n=1 Tax=Puccinia graminis f. sp. tritici (strain CRL 75-36-700-3 / race SCCL) TaxID=418459 RepID=H6QSD1_PUCGT|nr:uncharacterized protein PGTG_21668 [Puccinia graminis f. sp. tritici CRL 75-36-700-3]EHS63659.1 hypothetical protein PGTG_21668 [Puccinia graminis f. sp. tritici CRL 75-36-700-3]
MGLTLGNRPYLASRDLNKLAYTFGAFKYVSKLKRGRFGLGAGSHRRLCGLPLAAEHSSDVTADHGAVER